MEDENKDKDLIYKNYIITACNNSTRKRGKYHAYAKPMGRGAIRKGDAFKLETIEELGDDKDVLIEKVKNRIDQIKNK